MDGIFALNDMHNPLFQEYFDTFIKDMLRRVNPETIEKLKIEDDNKVIIESYSTDVDIVILTEEQKQQLREREQQLREQQTLERQLHHIEIATLRGNHPDGPVTAPAGGGRRRTMKSRRRKLSKKKKSKTKRKRN